MNTYKHILLATDFSDLSARVADRAAELAGRCDAELVLLHVIEHFPEDIPIDAIAPEDVDCKEYLTSLAHTALKELAQRLGRGAAQRVVKLNTHSAKAEILRFAREAGIDLIVLGAHGAHGLSGLLGSTASAVVQGAPCDVLAVRG
jgi:universal stress protein A